MIELFAFLAYVPGGSGKAEGFADGDGLAIGKLRLPLPPGL